MDRPEETNRKVWRSISHKIIQKIMKYGSELHYNDDQKSLKAFGGKDMSVKIRINQNQGPVSRKFAKFNRQASTTGLNGTRTLPNAVKR